MRGLRPFQDEWLEQVKTRGKESPHVDENTRHSKSFSFAKLMGFRGMRLLSCIPLVCPSHDSLQVSKVNRSQWAFFLNRCPI